jgi:hypothetical protein
MYEKWLAEQKADTTTFTPLELVYILAVIIWGVTWVIPKFL